MLFELISQIFHQYISAKLNRLSIQTYSKQNYDQEAFMAQDLKDKYDNDEKVYFLFVSFCTPPYSL